MPADTNNDDGLKMIEDNVPKFRHEGVIAGVEIDASDKHNLCCISE